MGRGIASIVLALLCTGATAALFIGLQGPASRSVKWTPAGYFLLLLAWAGSIGYAVGAVTGERRVVGYVLGSNTRYFGVSQTLVAGAGLLTLAFCLIAVRIWVRRWNVIGGSGLLAVGIGCLGLFINVFNEVDSNTRGYVGLAAAIMALAAAALIRPGPDAVLGPAVYGVTLGVVSGLVAVFNPDSAFQGCRADKCGPMGLLFLGALGNENALGLALALSLPFVLLAFRGSIRWWLGSYMFIMVYLTGSRSALIAAGVALGVALLCNPRITDKGAHGRFGFVAAATAAVAVGVGLILPFVTSDPTAFSLRGIAWQTARRYISESPIFGSGADAWQALANNGEVSAVSAYSAHNMWLDLLFTTGIVGLILGIVLVLALVRTSPPWLLALPLITVFAAGIIERPWTLTVTNWLVWVLPALLLLRSDRTAYSPSTLARAQHNILPKANAALQPAT